MIALTLALCFLPASQVVAVQELHPPDPSLRTMDLALPGAQADLRAAPSRLPRVQVFEAQEQAARAWIGVEIATEPSDRRGLGVARVVDGSPAARAGLSAGDHLVALDGEAVPDFDALREHLDGRRPGQRIGLTLLREVRMRLDERGWGDDGGPRLGVSLSDRSSDGGSALVVSGLERGWPAAAAGLRSGDRLVAANGRELASFDTLQDVLGTVEPGEAVEILLERRVELTLGTFPYQEAPSGGYFFEELPDRPGQDERDAGPDREGEFLFGTPRPQGRTDRDEAPQPQRRYRWLEVPQTPDRPQASTPFGQSQPDGRQLQEQMQDLARELRSLREELRSLRAELEQLRRQRAR